MIRPDSPCGMVALAPCSPFSVSERAAAAESAILARVSGRAAPYPPLRDEGRGALYVLERCGMRPLAYMESLGWVGPDVWYAHGIHFNGRGAAPSGGDRHRRGPLPHLQHEALLRRVPGAGDAANWAFPWALRWTAAASQRRLQSAGGAAGVLSAPPSPIQRQGSQRLRRSEARHRGHPPRSWAGTTSAALEVGKCRRTCSLIDTRRLELVGAML